MNKEKLDQLLNRITNETIFVSRQLSDGYFEGEDAVDAQVLKEVLKEILMDMRADIDYLYSQVLP